MSSLARRQFLFGRAPSAGLAGIADTCLELRGVVCRACGDACDVVALRFMPLPGGLAQVVVDAERCTGCGACIPVCPTASIALAAR